MRTVRAALSTLFAICALAAATDALFDDERAGMGLRIVCGLSIALCVVRLLGSMLE